MSQELSTTAYALLGLLAFDGPNSPSMTRYELKQRADRTMRFYWVAPAMSQVYTELERLARLELVSVTQEQAGRRGTQRYAITAAGLRRLQDWFATSPADFPILKHATALKLMMGALIGPERIGQLLRDYLDQLAAQRQDLQAVRDFLGDLESRRYPAMVADWGLSYYDAEAEIVHELLSRLPDGQVFAADPPGGDDRAGRGRTPAMTSTPEDTEDYDQDSEPTMTAPVEGRPTGIDDDTVGETQSDISSPDADDQSGAESPDA